MKIAKNDSTKTLEIPDPSEISPLDLALLKKGIKGAIIVSIFNLWRYKKVEIIKTKYSVLIKQVSDNAIGLNKLENIILQSTGKPKIIRYFFTNKSISTLQKVLQPNKEKLEDLKLLADNKTKVRYTIISILALITMLSLGVTKMYLGIINDKPIIFLIILIVISIVSFILIIQPHKTEHTNLGSRLISSSKERFEWLKTCNVKSIMMDDNLLYGVAIFGIASFVDSNIGGLLEYPSLLENSVGSSNGYGCGGAGCSGGCGGGCGGCGGCGG